MVAVNEAGRGDPAIVTESTQSLGELAQSVGLFATMNECLLLYTNVCLFVCHNE